jgi:hypothetical protein
VFNGIWDVGHGFQVSGLYFYGSGQRSQIVCGCDARGLQIVSVDRLRNAAAAARVGAETGSIIPRESFVGDPIHRVDLRLQQRVPLGGQRSIDGFLDIFNAFNRANFGSYELRENNAAFLQPTQSTNLSYAPRTLQLGFRFRF